MLASALGFGCAGPVLGSLGEVELETWHSALYVCPKTQLRGSVYHQGFHARKGVRAEENGSVKEDSS